MPELRNCKRCNKVFSYVAGLPICPACVKEDERIFDEVSAYIREHPGVSLKETAAELDISYEKIMKFVREGRLQIRAANGEYVNFCEKCGAEITKGKLCESCESHITNVLDTSKKNLQGKLAEASGDRGGYHLFKSEAKK